MKTREVMIGESWGSVHIASTSGETVPPTSAKRVRAGDGAAIGCGKADGEKWWKWSIPSGGQRCHARKMERVPLTRNSHDTRRTLTRTARKAPHLLATPNAKCVRNFGQTQGEPRVNTGLHNACAYKSVWLLTPPCESVYAFLLLVSADVS